MNATDSAPDDDETLWELTTSTFEHVNTTSPPPHPEAERVNATYREVWHKFFHEAREQSRAQIEALCRRPSRADHDTSLEDEILQRWRDEAEAGESKRARGFESDDAVMEEEEEREPQPAESYVTIRTERYPVLREHPMYEACAPSVRNMSFRAGDPADLASTELHFVPYADAQNPPFDSATYSEQFERVAWEWDLDDNPDVETIKAETLRRLHFGQKLDFETIDATGILTTSTPLRKSNEDGLLWYLAQRDPVPWFKNLEHNHPKLPATTYKASHPKELFINSASVFCSNLNCVMAMCPTHPAPNPPRPFPKATKTAFDLRCIVTESCGKHCISTVSDQDRESVPPRVWTESDIKDLETILMIEPDALPCHLAVLCRKTCWEAYEERCRILPDAAIFPDSNPPESAPKPKFSFRDSVNETLKYSLPPGPCQHEGPCSIENRCTCWEAKFHCTRQCYCDSTTCHLQWKGCECYGPCGDACVCKAAGRECDINVCACPKYSESGRFCDNMDIQRGHSTPLEVKVGMYGLGAFAMEDIRKGTYIGEYVGELSADVEDTRGEIRDHVGLNYLFEMNDADAPRSLTSDSARVGNETRYINHPASPRGKNGKNVAARLFLVNGDFRMGIWSTKVILKGEELFLDYGKKYFKYFREQEQGRHGHAEAKTQKRRRRKNW
ncbi:hypothetical protein OF83DRAFT_631595 [Amylostereum chailletii]|nr:hypothetical protein OF83DRAFT_631595 [Amylostereum chailletii]